MVSPASKRLVSGANIRCVSVLVRSMSLNRSLNGGDRITVTRKNRTSEHFYSWKVGGFGKLYILDLYIKLAEATIPDTSNHLDFDIRSESTHCTGLIKTPEYKLNRRAVVIAGKDGHCVVIMTGRRTERRASGGKHGPFKNDRKIKKR